MIQVEGLNLTVGAFALQDVDLQVTPGEYFVLLGPSGSGKTLFLESLCGLRRVDCGRITIDGVDVTHVEPRGRSIGYLPQDYALFPHLSVRSNVGFGLANTLALAMGTGQERIDHVMQMVGISHLGNRRPRHLSGGEKQRVALARALAIRPRVLVLDEPVSALDEQTRDSLCRQVKQLQRETDTTAIHVCHNFAEMMVVADRVGIIHEGRIVQVGTPQTILQQPRTSFVARFVQSGNVFCAQAEPQAEWICLQCLGGAKFFAPRSSSCAGSSEVLFVVRPESIQLTRQPPQDIPQGTTVLEGQVQTVTDLGPLVQVRVACDTDVELLVSLGKREYKAAPVWPGDRVCLMIEPQDVHVLDE